MAYSTDWRHNRARVGFPSITAIVTDLTGLCPLGTRATAIDNGTNQNGEGEFVLVKGVTNGATGSWVTINEDDYSTALLAANAIGRVGILMSDLDATTKYGWAQVRGKAVGKCLASYADNGTVYCTATAGSVDDASVTGDKVWNAKGASAIDGPATGMAEFEIDCPYTVDTTVAIYAGES